MEQIKPFVFDSTLMKFYHLAIFFSSNKPIQFFLVYINVFATLFGWLVEVTVFGMNL